MTVAFLSKYGFMKTTMELPDALFTTVKIALASEGISMKECLTHAILMRLKMRQEPIEKPWLKAFGGLKDLDKENRKLDRLIADEFGQVDTEDWN